MSIRIPINEWDDKIHRQSDEFMAWTDPEQGQSYDLERRASRRPFWERDCRTVLACAKHFRGHINLGNGWPQAVHTVMQYVPYGQRFYDWAHKHTYSVSMLSPQLRGAGTTYAGYALGRSHGGALPRIMTKLPRALAQTLRSRLASWRLLITRPVPTRPLMCISFCPMATPWHSLQWFTRKPSPPRLICVVSGATHLDPYVSGWR